MKPSDTVEFYISRSNDSAEAVTLEVYLFGTGALKHVFDKVMKLRGKLNGVEAPVIAKRQFGIFCNRAGIGINEINTRIALGVAVFIEEGRRKNILGKRCYLIAEGLPITVFRKTRTKFGFLTVF